MHILDIFIMPSMCCLWKREVQDVARKRFLESEFGEVRRRFATDAAPVRVWLWSEMFSLCLFEHKSSQVLSVTFVSDLRSLISTVQVSCSRSTSIHGGFVGTADTEVLYHERQQSAFGNKQTKCGEVCDKKFLFHISETSWLITMVNDRCKFLSRMMNCLLACPYVNVPIFGILPRLVTSTN